MLVIEPISKLTNYPQILREVQEGTPVVLTWHGKGSYVVTKLSDYEALVDAAGMSALQGLKYHRGD